MSAWSINWSINISKISVPSASTYTLFSVANLIALSSNNELHCNQHSSTKLQEDLWASSLSDFIIFWWFHVWYVHIRRDRWRIVIDGGMLLYKFPWVIGSSLSSILDSYVNYVNGIGEGTDIIFDNNYLYLTQQF